MLKVAMNVKNHMFHCLCGYARIVLCKRLLKCDECITTLETELNPLPGDFYEQIPTSLRDTNG